ncbi:MAG TPA: DEAD/DEAH box helicase, partial [Chloroflexota bacterium]|nr:DEAD/DEAH box helicase [Chloroflexota bacterium]
MPAARRRATRARPADRSSELIDRFRAGYGFPLDPFQLEAIRHLEAGRSVLVAAPTGSGKTVLAEFGLFLAREQRLRAIYTSPIKALSNQKFRDWRALHGDAVGLFTGDVTENPNGSVMVMTTEVLRNMLLETPHSLDDVGIVVFDEVHFLADPDRGTTWEESILYCPRHVQLVCLSATVPNAGEITTWISHVHRETALVSHAERSVPLEHLYLVDDQLVTLVDERGTARQPLRVGGEARVPRPEGAGRQRPRDVPRPRDVVQLLDENRMLPAIYFIFGRRACEIAASDCTGLDLISDRGSRAARRERIEAYLRLLAPEDRMLDQVQSLVKLLYRGVAFHHAGLLPLLKSLVEELFAAGHIGAVFATETLALGINMPARSVVIAEQTKFDGESRRPLLPNEYAQLVGRAGRRGLDPKGFAVNLYSPWVACAETLDTITGELLPIRSSFTPRYNTVASLWDGTTAARDRLVRLFASSLRQFQMNDALKEAAVEVEALRDRAAKAHFECPYDGIPDEAVQEYVRLRRELADARKRASRAAADSAALRRQLLRPPWPAPNPDVVRREFQRFAGGEVVYVSGARGEEGEPRPGAWGVFLRRHHAGPGLILLGDRIEEVTHWADITRLPDGRPAVDLPGDAQDVEGPVEDARRFLGPRVWRAIQAGLAKLDLPDLAGVEARRLAAAQRELDERLGHAGDRESRRAGDVAQLEEALAGHPCAKCPVRADHERALRAEQAAIRALAEAESHEAALEERAASQAQRTLDSLTTMLRRFAYLETSGDDPTLRPTPKTAALARLYDPNGLLLLNLAWDGAFDHLAPAELMELLSWFCYDRDGPRWNRHQLTPRLWDLRPQVGDALDRVRAAEQQAGLGITLGPNSAFYGPVLAWCRRATFAELLDKIPISEGDLLLALNKTLDLATQLRESLRTSPDSHPRQLAAKLEVGDNLLRRGIVAQSLKLAIGLPDGGPGASPPR